MVRFTKGVALFEVSAPSNIALIKYWGKTGNQLPCNPSLSMTLTHAKTLSQFKVQIGSGKFTFLLEGSERIGFDSKAHRLWEKIAESYPALLKYDVVVDSRNTFPHGAGIASSASGMAALAQGLLALADVTDKKVVSDFARQGSGSACRSVFDQFALWGKSEHLPHSSDLYACDVSNIHAEFVNMGDAIVIVSSREKSVSSTAGHELMNHHPYAKRRFEVARENLAILLAALEKGDWEGLIDVCEREALELHSMMMTGRPSYTLMTPATLDFIIRFRSWRDENKVKAAFTLDAGPNIHVLHAHSEKERVEAWLNELISEKKFEARLLFDVAGLGAQTIDLSEAQQ